MIRNHLALVLCVLCFCSCSETVIVGRGPAKDDSRNLGSGSFTNIKISAPLDARVTVGGAPSLSFRGPGNILSLIRSEVRGNTLHIFTDEDKDLRLKDHITAVITMPRLTGIDISGSADVYVAGKVTENEFAVDISGAGTVDIAELHVQSFSADMSGAAALNLHSGAIAEASYDGSGAVEISGFGTRHRNVTMELTGAGSAELTVESKLSVEVSGAGDVRYKGHPVIRKDISGAGSVTDAN